MGLYALEEEEASPLLLRSQINDICKVNFEDFLQDISTGEKMEMISLGLPC